MINFGSFEQLCKYVRKNDSENILKECLFEQLKLTNNQITEDMTVQKLKTLFDEDPFRSADNNSKYFEMAIVDIKCNLDKYIWVYETLLKDEKSKTVYLDLLISRITANPKHLRTSYEDEPHYFNENIFKFSEDEVYVDCGAYVGDTIIEFAAACPFFKKIFAYEAIPQVYNSCLDNISALSNVSEIAVRENAVFDKSCELHFEFGNGVGDSKFTSSGNIDVKAIKLDDDICEKITFIKMDIEGSEKAALEGARKHIQEETPKLAICIYHLVDDLWKIPELIYEMNSNYNFIIRHHGNYQYYDSVLYCIPKVENRSSDNSRLSMEQKLSRCIAINKYLSYISKEEQDQNQNIADSKIWLKEQLGTHAKELKRQNAIIDDLKSWASQLTDAKEYLAKQNEDLKNLLESKMAEPWYKNILRGKKR